MKNLSYLVISLLTQFTFSQNSNQSVRDFVEEKYFSNQETGRSIKFGYISSLNTYGLTFKDSEGNLAYFMNCTIDISKNNQYMALTFCMSPVTGDSLGKIGVYKDRMIWYGTDGSLVFYLENYNLDSAYNNNNNNQSNSFESEKIKSIIGKKIIIGKLQVAQKEFGYKMTYEDAVIECGKLGKGWRIPTKEELNIIYKNRLKTGGFNMDDGMQVVKGYWTSTKAGDNNKVFCGYITKTKLEFEPVELGKDKYGEEFQISFRAVKSL
jgi:hypothetical protein